MITRWSATSGQYAQHVKSNVVDIALMRYDLLEHSGSMPTAAVLEFGLLAGKQFGRVMEAAGGVHRDPACLPPLIPALRAGGPVQTVSNVSAWLQEGCRSGLNGKQLYDKQDLFTIYIHRSPGASASPPDSIFHGRDIEQRCTPCFRRMLDA